jgi:hypothetical protein
MYTFVANKMIIYVLVDLKVILCDDKFKKIFKLISKLFLICYYSIVRVVNDLPKKYIHSNTLLIQPFDELRQILEH